MIEQDLPSRPVDVDTGAILDMISKDATHRVDRAAVVDAIKAVAIVHHGRIDPNRVRELIPQWVYPKVIGPTYRALALSEVIHPDGWVASDDRRGGNAGRPARRYRWNFEAQRSLDKT